MQLTRLDHWLKQKFLHQTYIFSLRLPEQKLPRGVEISNVESNKKGDYKYKLVVKKNKTAEETIKILRDEGLMHATHVVDVNNGFNKLIVPSNGRSFTFLWLGRFVLLSTLFSFCWFLYKLSKNEKFSSSIRGAVQELIEISN